MELFINLFKKECKDYATLPLVCMASGKFHKWAGHGKSTQDMNNKILKVIKSWKNIFGKGFQHISNQNNFKKGINKKFRNLPVMWPGSLLQGCSLVQKQLPWQSSRPGSYEVTQSCWTPFTI